MIETQHRQRMVWRAHAINIALVVLAIIALFWRVFLLGETLIDVNTLNNQLPWGYHAGQSDYSYNRRDLTDTYVTRDYFVVSAYRAGEFPFWNPFTMAGHPIYADGVTRTLSPLLLFYKVFDVPLGYSLARLAELMLAAVFMYIFLVTIGAGASGALTGSLVFALSAHSMLHVTGLGWWGGFLWLPLIIMFVDRAIRRSSYAYAILAGVALGAQFFCGYLPNQIYYVGAVLLYYLFFAFVARRSQSGSGAFANVIVMMFVTLASGLALSATQWVPSLELLSYSNRKIVGAELGYVYLPPWYAATLLFPNLFGSAYDAKMLTLFSALGVSHDHILYLGVASLVPLGFALYWLRHTGKRTGEGTPIHEFAKLDVTVRRRVVFFAVLGACSVVLMMAAPLYVHVTRFIPILQVIRVAVRAGVLFLFAASVLVAFGAKLMLHSGSDALGRFFTLARRFAVAVAAFVLLAVIGSYLIKVTGVAVDSAQRGRLAFIRRAALALSAQFTPPNANVLIPLGLVFASVFLVWALIKGHLTRKSFLVLLVVTLTAELFWNSRQFDRSFDRARVFPKTEITDRLASLPFGRVLVTPSDLESNRKTANQKIIAPPNTLLPYQIPVVTGKNQQFPRWYREFASLIEPQPNLSHVVFDQYRSAYFDLLNVRYVMTHESAPPLEGYELVTSAEGVSLYQNRAAMPRAFFVREVVAVETPQESLAALRDASFDPRTTAVVEARALRFNHAAGASHSPPGAAAIVEDKRNRVAIETDDERDGLLVLSDNDYPGWRAYIDDVRVEVLRANHTMRAVEVPAGRHMVTFVFKPAAFFTSMYISIAAAVMAVAALILGAIKRKRE